MAEPAAEDDAWAFDQRRKQGRRAESRGDGGGKLQWAISVPRSEDHNHRHVDEIDAEAQLAGFVQKTKPHDARQQRFRRMEKAVNHSADDEGRERKDSVVVGLPDAARRHFRHPGIMAEEREPAEGDGEKESKRGGGADPGSRAGETNAAVGDERIEEDAADKRIRVMVEPKRHPRRRRRALMPRDRDRDAPCEIGPRQDRRAGARPRRRQNQRQNGGKVEVERELDGDRPENAWRLAERRGQS